MATNSGQLREGKRRFAPIASATVIVPGDMLALVANLVVAYAGTNFLGISEDHSRDGDTADIRVQCREAQFDVDLVSAQYKYGDRLEFDSTNKLKALSVGEPVAVIIDNDTGAGAVKGKVELLDAEDFRDV